MDQRIEMKVNGESRATTTDPMRPLLEVIREDWSLTGTKYGCGEGRCGACSVLLDGRRIFSCKVPVQEAAGKNVTTIEGLAQGDKLSKVQQAFLDEGAYQCGYCIAGMIVAATAFLNDRPQPTEPEIIDWMSKNVCRCCGYPAILRAVRRAAGLNEPAAR